MTRIDRIPNWPAMMTRRLAADYCCLSEAQFEREICDGRLPPPVKLGGRDSWHRATIDKYLEKIANPELDWRATSPIYADRRAAESMDEAPPVIRSMRRPPSKAKPLVGTSSGKARKYLQDIIDADKKARKNRRGS